MIRALGPVALLVALAALLIFTNLDGRLLWDDEAETALLAPIWVLYFFFFVLRRDRPFAVLGLAVALTVLFHSNYLICFATVAGLVLAFFAARPNVRAALRLVSAGVATVLINFPSITVFDLQGKCGSGLAAASVKHLVAKLAWLA